MAHMGSYSQSSMLPTSLFTRVISTSLSYRNIARTADQMKNQFILETTKPGWSQLSWVNLIKESIELGWFWFKLEEVLRI